MIIEIPQDEGKVYRRFTYPAGETQVRILDMTGVCNTGSIVVKANIRSSDDLVTLVLLTDALHEATNGDAALQLQLPYLPYSRADRRFVDGDCFGLKAFGKIIDSLGYQSVITLDAHSPKARKCVANLVDVSPFPLIRKAIKAIGEPTIVLPDEGAKRYAGMNWPSVQCYKKRNPVTGELLSFDVPGKHHFSRSKDVLIVDDICDGGGTFIGLAKALTPFELNLFLYVSHGIFSKGTDELLKYYKHIYSSDSFDTKFPGVTRLSF